MNFDRPAEIDLSLLRRIARDTVERRAAEPGLRSAYLVGSVAASEPPLGNAADIDLIFIHEESPARRREIVPLSDTVSFDITHHGPANYAAPVTLRIHPWRGPEMCEPVFLHDPTHFFERAQAAARARFHRADHVRSRAQAFLNWAREEMSCLEVAPIDEGPAPEQVRRLCRSLQSASNAVLTLTAFPAAARKLALKFEAGAARLGRLDLYEGFLSVLGAGDLKPKEIRAWLPDWRSAYQAAGQDSQPEPIIHPARLGYYLSGCEALLFEGRPRAALWPLLATWSAALQALQQEGDRNPGSIHRFRWQSALARLGMDTAAGFRERVAGLAAFVSECEGVVRLWAEQNGADNHPHHQ